MLTVLGIIVILIGITILIWNGIRKSIDDHNETIVEDYRKKTQLPPFPLGGKFWYYILGGIFIITLNGMFFWAEAGTAYAVQYPWGGDKMVKTQGIKTKMWGKTIPLSYEISIQDKIMKEGESLTESADGIYSRKASLWEFSDAIKAEIGTAIVIGVNTDDEEIFLKMADANRSESKLIYGRVMPNIDAALKNTCKLMDAQEYISGKASDFDRYFRDQLENGTYLVEEYYEEETLPEIIGDTNIIRTITGSTKRSSKQLKFRIKKDSQGNIIRDNKSNTLKQYGITIYQAQVTGIDWEQSFDARLQLQKEQVAQTQLEKQEAEKEFYRAKKEIAKGESEKAKERAKLEKEQIKLTIAAETEAKVAEQNLIAEKKKYEVAQYEAKSTKVKADADAYKNRLLVNAGLTPQERANLDKEIAIGVAAEISKLKLPDTYITSGSGNNSSGLLESLIGADLAKKMGTK